MTSSLTNETEKDVLPWLKLAEDLRLLHLDVEVSGSFSHGFCSWLIDFIALYVGTL